MATLQAHSDVKNASRYDPREATIASTQHALLTRQTTVRQVVSSYISRIETLNPYTNALIALDPTSLSAADTQDARLSSFLSSSKTISNLSPSALLVQARSTLGTLFGIPLLIKDNIDTSPLPTTCGSLALFESHPSSDAAVIASLRSVGAIVFAKTNLHEMALEGISVSSLGGQTINPYDSTRTPGGSSGGTGAAVAASFGVAGLGTDTVNSVRSPASACGLVGLRPTTGLVDGKGVVPVSWTQDVVGPIGRCVEDVAVLLGGMVGGGRNYAGRVKEGRLEGLRIGRLEGFFDRSGGDETVPVNEAMKRMEDLLVSNGARIVPIADRRYDANALLTELDTQKYEYRECIDGYLQNSELKGTHPRTLKEFYDSKDGFIVLPRQYDHVQKALTWSTTSDSQDYPKYADVKKGIATLTEALREDFRDNKLDAIIYPQQKNLVVKLGTPNQHGRNGILAALTGYPSICVPAGFSQASSQAPLGVPIGMELLGIPQSEEKLLQIAYQLEVAARVRRAPKWAEEDVQVTEYQAVPHVRPDTGNIPASYPLGVIE